MAGSDEISASRKALGRQLAAYRKAAGYSQHDLAPLTHYARSTIANVEVGRQNVPRSFWTICDDLLQAGGALTRGSDGLNSLIQRQRREVTGYVAANGTLGHESSGCHDTSDTTDPPYFLPDGIGRLMRAMLHPAADDNAPPDVTELSERVLRAWQLRQSANYAELADHLTSLIPDIEHAIASTRDETQQAHTRLAVHAYNAASSLLKRLGGADLALLAADRAARAAADLDDAILGVAASYRVANVLLSAARLDGSRQVALRAADAIAPGRSTTPLSLASWGGLLLTAAVATARGGSESSAWELLGEARTASRLLATDYADVHTIFGPTNVAIMPSKSRSSSVMARPLLSARGGFASTGCLPV